MGGTGLKLWLERLEIDAVVGRDFAAAEQGLKSLERKSRIFADWPVVYRLSYEAAAPTFERRQDQINTRRPGRLPVESRPAETRLEALKRALEHEWPPTDLAANLSEVHATLFAEFAPDLAGRFRSTELRMGSGHASALPEHVAVEPEAIGPALAELMAAVASLEGRHPLAAIVALYAGIINIHPFLDGNGRATRTIVDSALVRAGLAARPLLCLESALRTHDRRNAYLLNRLHDFGEWPDLLSFFARAIDLGARTTERALQEEIGRAFYQFR